MNLDTIKTYAILASITFVSAFLGTLGTIFAAIPVDNWTQATWVSLLLGAIISAAQTALKVVLDKFIPVRLGGKK